MVRNLLIRKFYRIRLQFVSKVTKSQIVKHAGFSELMTMELVARINKIGAFYGQANELL